MTSPDKRASAAAPLALDTMVALRSNREIGLTIAEAQARLARDGANEVPRKESQALFRFAKKFWGVSAWMIELIAVLSFVLHKKADLAIALVLLIANAVMSFIQEERALRAVTALRQQLQVTARVLRDGKWSAMAARALVAGDIVRVRAGDLVPADLQICEGTLRVDQSALTGESREIEHSIDALVYSGSTVRRGEASGVVTATGVRSFLGRTAELVESAHPKLHVEEVIARVVRWLVSIVVVLAVMTIGVSMIRGLPLVDIIPISLVLLMSAVPVALPVMFSVSMAIGSMELGRLGVLIARPGAIEDAANMTVLCADKTGTLTMNRLSLEGLLPQPGFSKDNVLTNAALASNEANADPIDLAFLRAATEQKSLPDGPHTIISFLPFSADTRRTEAVVEIAGQRIRVVKGALRTVATAAGLGDAEIAALEATASHAAEGGTRVLAVARAEAADGTSPLRLVGLALLRDPLRPDSRQLLEELRALGIAVKMLTGDALSVAREIGGQLGLGTIVRAPELRVAREGEPSRVGPDDANALMTSEGIAEMFPEGKFIVVKTLQSAGGIVGMTGDGVNDAPALRQAEVGIAVMGATDVAKSAAGAVLTRDGLSGIVDLVKSGRAIYQRVLTWIINKVSQTILKAGFVVIAFLATGRFVISALGMVLLVFMTDFVKIALSTDKVRPSQRPESWNIGPLIRVSIVLGVLMLAETLGLLGFAWHRFGLAADDGKLQTFVFQALLFFSVFSIVSVRERRSFWATRPSRLLALGLVFDVIAGALVGRFGISELKPLPDLQSAFVFGYSAVCCLTLNDLIKSFLTARALRAQSVVASTSR